MDILSKYLKYIHRYLAHVTTAVPTYATLLTITTNGTTFCLIALLACLPILYGSSDINKGAVDEGCINAFKTHVKGMGFWAHSIAVRCLDIQQVVLTL